MQADLRGPRELGDLEKLGGCLCILILHPINQARLKKEERLV